MAKRSERLLMLLQAFRRRRRPASGQELAAETGVSLRSLYRDVATLRSLGAVIDGEPGVGFQLRADYWLPPLMFSEEEIEALVLGLRTVVYGPDADMANVAKDARAKIAAMLPAERRDTMEAIGLFAIPAHEPDNADTKLSELRRALREELQTQMHYRAKDGAESERIVWPMALGYMSGRQMLVAWCSLRNDFRSFWVDAVLSLDVLPQKYPTARRTLMHEWRQRDGIADIS